MQDLNDRGEATGWAWRSGAPRAVRWFQGMVQDLGTLGGGASEAYAINEAGAIAGKAQLASGAYHAFLWDPAGGMLDLGTLPSGGQTMAYGLNDAGEVVGGSIPPWLLTMAWRWSPSTGIVALGTLGGCCSDARAINDAGVIAGGANNQVDVPRAMRVVGGVMEDLGTLARGNMSFAHDINQGGWIAGLSYMTGDPFQDFKHAFLWDPGLGTMADLGTLGGDESIAWALNDGNVVVGQADTTAGDTHAFAWDPSQGMVDLNDHLPVASTIVLRSATAVNNRGWIAANGRDQGNEAAFLLRPVLLSPPAPGAAGQVNRVVLHNATPGARLQLLWSLQEGRATVPSCPGRDLGLAAPRLAASAVAGPGGVATFQVFVPPSAAGRTIYLQAIEKASCLRSQVLATTF